MESDTQPAETEPPETKKPQIDMTNPVEIHGVIAPAELFDGYDLIERLVRLFNEDAPLKWKEIKDEDGDGLPDETAAPDRQTPNDKDETGETGEEDKEPEKQYIQVYPQVLAYAYLDLTTGAAVTYNADTVYYSASLIKAAYVYLVLCEIEEFEALDHEYDDDGKIIYSDEDRRYDLSETWTYDWNTMFVDGSGEIKNIENSTEMMWLQLFEYALVYSDSIAFTQIADRFGYNVYYSNAWKIGIDGMREGFMRLTANGFFGDVVGLTKEIHKIVHSDSGAGGDGE